MKNTAVILLALTAILTASLAVAFRPVTHTQLSINQVSECLTETETETEKEICQENSTETAKIEPSHKESTTAVKLLPTEKETAESTTERKIESRIVSLIDKEIQKLGKSRETISKSVENEITPQEFRRIGVIYYNGYKYTWYSERVLPGRGLNIPGRHSDGNFVRDENNYICVASCDLPKGTVVDTPFGKGKVYDVCGQSGTIDIYVSW